MPILIEVHLYAKGLIIIACYSLFFQTYFDGLQIHVIEIKLQVPIFAISYFQLADEQTILGFFTINTIL